MLIGATTTIFFGPCGEVCLEVGTLSSCCCLLAATTLLQTCLVTRVCGAAQHITSWTMPSKRRRTAVGTAAPGTSARRPKSTSGKKHKKRHKRGHASEEQRLQDLVFGALVTEEVSVPTAAVHDSADEHSADSGADAGAGAGAGAGSGVQSDSSDAESGAAVEGRKTDAPAWVDPDDAQISVKLTSVAKLRKLRKEKDEDVVSGKALSKRLRAQFNKMHGSAGEGAGWAVAKDTDAGALPARAWHSTRYVDSAHAVSRRVQCCLPLRRW